MYKETFHSLRCVDADFRQVECFNWLLEKTKILWEENREAISVFALITAQIVET